MAEPIVRSFVIDTTQAEQNLQRLDVVTTATNASLDGLYNQLIALDAQLQKLDPNSQAFAEVNTQIQQLETTITGIETGKIDDIGKAIESIDAGNAAQSIEQVGDAVQQVVTPVNDLANATDQLNAELKETKVDTSSIETASSDFQELAVEQEQVTTSSKSLKAQLRELQAELANTEPDSAKYRELSQAAGELKDKISDAAEAVGTQAGGAFERVGGSLGLVTSRIASLDFTGAAEGAKQLAANIGQVKPGDIAKGISSIGSAFASVGKALLTNPIFLVGAAIAAAIVYAEELLSLIDGVTDAETAALDVQKERAAVAKQNYDNISATEETLKRQGMTEKEITALKLQALNTAIAEQQAVIQTTRIQAEG
jgi:predicted RNase H-like nuclease (RuvC/YqgF family)